MMIPTTETGGSDRPESFDTLYKILVLYMLSCAEQPLTKVQISDFMTERGYLGYLTLQKVFSMLTDAGLIEPERVRNRTFLHITPEGLETLRMFSNELTAEIKTDAVNYLSDNSVSLRQSIAVLSDYKKNENGSGGYQVSMTLTEHASPIASISVQLPTEDMARHACQKWDECHEEIYSYIMKKLL
ncbi:MAG: DUF4364 family protein [Lachnospiraceae bacterium]|nr:DUF4364 family protein [Lachnospiraceae bacterium]